MGVILQGKCADSDSEGRRREGICSLSRCPRGIWPPEGPRSPFQKPCLGFSCGELLTSHLQMEPRELGSREVGGSLPSRQCLLRGPSFCTANVWALEKAEELRSHTLGWRKDLACGGQWWADPQLLLVAAGGPGPRPHLWAQVWHSVGAPRSGRCDRWLSTPLFDDWVNFPESLMWRRVAMERAGTRIPIPGTGIPGKNAYIRQCRV